MRDIISLSAEGANMENIMDSPFKAISILYRKSHIWLNDVCVEHSLTAAQALVILIVCDFQELTQDDITKRLSLDKSVIAKTVTKLVTSGFLTRDASPRDRRTYDIRPTEKAWSVYSFIGEQIDLCFERMTARMSEAERSEFRRLLLIAAESAAEYDGE
jgi:DNA-binding MarR family transcriptional regulator